MFFSSASLIMANAGLVRKGKQLVPINWTVFRCHQKYLIEIKQKTI